MVTHLSFCEKKDNWPAGAIANRVRLGVQSTFRAADETAIDRGRIPPSQTIPDHMDYPANHTPVVHARNATRPREKGFNALKLSFSQPETSDGI
jgi:hypothetical protein